MNIAEAFVELLEDLGIGTFGQDIFIGQAPSSNKVPDSIWWVISSGGSPARIASGESIKTYHVEIYCRNRDYKLVYDDLHSLEEQLNCDNCVELDGFDTVKAEAEVLSIDDDLDAEDRKVGLLQVTLTTYKECNNGIS
jgi:hypothetical protein